MPRANRHFLPNHVWHITHRCHEKTFLLRFARDRRRFAVVDLAGLSALCGFTEVARFQQAHRQWIEETLAADAMARDDRWSESIAIGSKAFVEKVKVELGIKARYREIGEADGTFALRESRRPYAPVFSGESDALRPDNTLLWDKTLEGTEA